MRRESHVRFWEGLGVGFPRATRLVVGFQYKDDAWRFLRELKQRLQQFALELHPDKTRLIEFGRFAAENRRERGLGKPETFDFLGFTHICGTTRQGKFTVRRKTIATRMRVKLKDLKEELRRRMHHDPHEVGQWLGRMLRGYFQYYAVPLNSRSLERFHYLVGRLWYKTLRRRSHRTRSLRTRVDQLIQQYLPRPRIVHPYPLARLRVRTQGRSPVR